MNRKASIVIAGGAIAGFFVVRKLIAKDFNTLPYGYGIKIKKSVTVNRPAEVLYSYWRNLTNLPRLFENVLSVEILDSSRSRWTFRVPGGINLEWSAEITVDRKNEMIGWRSLEDADLDNS